MITRKHLLFAIAATSLLTMFLIAIMPVRSQNAGEYDPWLDWNDDGKINLIEVFRTALAFGKSGDPVNKTALLINVNNTFTSLLSEINSCNSSIDDLSNRVVYLETNLITNGSLTYLSSRIDTLNSTLLLVQNELQAYMGEVNAIISGVQGNVTVLQGRTDNLNSALLGVQDNLNKLEGRVTTLEGKVTILETAVSQLQSNVTALQSDIDSLNSTVTYLSTAISNMNYTFTQQISALNASFVSLNNRVSALEANYSVTNLDLASSAIPFNMTYSDLHNFTTQTAYFDDMPFTSVTLTLNRTSQLLIMFSCNAATSAATVNQNCYIRCQVLVNETAAYPNSIELTPTMSLEIGSPYTHAHRIYNATCSYNFYANQLSAGTYTIKIRWYLSSQGTGDVWSRTLIVIALPA